MSETLSSPAPGSDLREHPLPAGRLARLIGREPEEWTVDDLVGVVGTLGIRLVSLMHVGGDGWLKTLDFAPRDVAHLREVLSFGERADGSSLFGAMGVPVTASDVVLRPRLSTAFVDPFATYPTLVVFCGHFGRTGDPLPESPDTIVRRAHDRLLAEGGLELHALGELEFFLGKRPEENDVYGAAERGYHASSPFVFGEALRRRAMVLLSEIGIPVKYGHSEVGYIQADDVDPRIWEQHEIELALQPLPQAADSVLVTQWMLRNLARQAGWRCSFEPILRKGHAGSGLHFHLSPVVDGVHQKHSSPDGRLQAPAKWLIAGLVRYADALMAFGNRTSTSFVRLTQAKEAPSSVTWGKYNRKALVRLPIVAADAQGRSVTPETVEFRLPDGSAHPHLLLAGIAQAMLAGRDLGEIDALLGKTACGTDASQAIAVPRMFSEVARGLSQNRAPFEAGQVFPAHVIDRTIEAIREM
ncbi:MAG TPA: glutamine synthetase beta-grasp domain-containing protein [Vicinamibacterales bacterium]|nr:glutamine synthetase beta-grasp domain-containing protein [Vicinamibacterales bacterium]